MITSWIDHFYTKENMPPLCRRVNLDTLCTCAGEGSVTLIFAMELKFLYRHCILQKQETGVQTSEPVMFLGRWAMCQVLRKELRYTGGLWQHYSSGVSTGWLSPVLAYPVTLAFAEKTVLAVSLAVHITTKHQLNQKKKTQNTICINLHWKDFWIFLRMNNTMTVYMF